jgi:hypothetical protein
MTARLVLALLPGSSLPSDLLPGAPRARLPLVHHGYPPEAAALALLGQDPARAWSGPAAFAAAGGGRVLREGETAWLLDAVHLGRDARGVVEGPLALDAGALAEVVGALEAELQGLPVELVCGPPCALVVREPLAEPSTAVAELLEGRELETFWEGRELLKTVTLAARRACVAKGRGKANDLVPHSPAGPLGVRPLADVWPEVRNAVVVGDGPTARALGALLRLDVVTPHEGCALSAAAEEVLRHDVVVAFLPTVPHDLSPLHAAKVVVAASEPDAEGTVELAVRGAALPTGPDPLRALLRLW